MIILGLDLETSGFSRDKDAVVEVGCAMYDTDLRTIVYMYSDFVQDTESPKWGDPNMWVVPKKICNITEEMVMQFGVKGEYVAEDVYGLIETADVVLAANGNAFDHPVLDNFFKRYDVLLSDKRWLDLQKDYPFPPDCKHMNMLYLCAYHGFLNPFPHRALFDTVAMLKISENYDIDVVMNIASSPTIQLIASVTYNTKDQASSRGFRWDGSDKIWHKEVKECMLNEEEIAEYPFKVSRRTLRD